MSGSRSARVLIVDDDAEFRETMQMLLEDAGYSVRAAGDGLAALRLLESERPDLMLVDLAMPRMTGNELIAEIERAGAMELSRIIVISATPKASGAKWHIPKPLQRELVLQVVRDFCANVSRADAPAQAG